MQPISTFTRYPSTMVTTAAHCLSFSVCRVGGGVSCYTVAVERGDELSGVPGRLSLYGNLKSRLCVASAVPEAQAHATSDTDCGS